MLAFWGAEFSETAGLSQGSHSAEWNLQNFSEGYEANKYPRQVALQAVLFIIFQVPPQSLLHS